MGCSDSKAIKVENTANKPEDKKEPAQDTHVMAGEEDKNNKTTQQSRYSFMQMLDF